jgi:phosphoglycerol geranylgeranyltransferase
MKFFKFGRKRKIKPKVFRYIRKRRKSKPLHFTLIDPDKQEPKKAAELAAKAKEWGSDAIMVGGSHAAQMVYLNDTIQAIKQKTDLPIILFPSSHSGISPQADSLFFMSLLNSRSTQYLIEEQVKGSILVKGYGIEPLSMAYLIVESGSMTTAAWSGDVKPLPRDKPELAVPYVLAARYLGMKFIYLEAGSGAKHPVPNAMIKEAKENMEKDMLLIVGGGIRDEKTAREKVKAGADIIVTGTIAEKNSDMLRKIIRAVKGKKV